MIEERIVAAAIKRDDGSIHSFAPPARHDTIINEFWNRTGKQIGGEDGFITNKFRFVDREEAWAIASKQNQIIKDCALDGTLVSENLW